MFSSSNDQNLEAYVAHCFLRFFNIQTRISDLKFDSADSKSDRFLFERELQRLEINFMIIVRRYGGETEKAMT